MERRAKQELWLTVAAIGTGCLFQPPLIGKPHLYSATWLCLNLVASSGLQAAMPIKDMATTTAAFGFTRSLAGTIGISVGNAIYSSELQKRLQKIPNVESFRQGRSLQQLANDVKGLTQIQVSGG